MASNGAIIAGRIFIWITGILILGIMGAVCYGCSCNIRASTFDNVEQREGLINMYGSVFWGYPMVFLAAVSGIALIGLLVVGYKHIGKTDTDGYTKIDTNKSTTTESSE